ncbi:MAG TPA: hypothetical protein PKJ19_03505 [Flavobacteriales bacterium]|nr:hypothetical protein [Flavobacteriales bacterium]
MPTLANIADDVLIALGYDHDDSLRHREAIMYNAALVINKLKGQRLNKHLKIGDHRSMADMLSTYVVAVEREDLSDTNVTGFDSTYFDLPTSIFDLDNGAAINFIRYLRNELPANCPPALARTPFTQTTLAGLNILYGSVYQRPAASRPYFARARKMDGANTKSRVYLFGVPENINHLLVGLYASIDFMTMDPNEPVDLPDELLLTAKKMLLEMEGWLLQIPQERLQSDGRDFEPGQVVRTSPAISVNHPSQLDD